MSKHNYSQYSNKNKDNRKAGVDTNVSDNRKAGVDTNAPVKPETQSYAKTQAPEVKLVEETVETVTLPEMVEGVVVNCAKLNVRAEPDIDARIVCVLDAMSKIEIDVAKSTDEWFKVCTAIGVEGYCMRKFVDAYL